MRQRHKEEIQERLKSSRNKRKNIMKREGGRKEGEGREKLFSIYYCYTESAAPLDKVLLSEASKNMCM